MSGPGETDQALDHTAVSSDPALDATVGTTDAPVRGGTRELPEVADGRYVTSSELGRGGIGRVLRARDEVLDRAVAVKELFATDDSSRRRFLREALITARLQHPAIVPVYDAGRRSDRSPFYAMKLVQGRPLERALLDATTLPQRLALVPTVLAVADAIAYAHNERIIHRDLKPANVLLGGFGETVVIDWGLAKDLSIDDRDALPAGPYRSDRVDQTVAGAVLGTPGYMAPEQAAGEEVDERADVYALGAMLYHVISGALPHQGTTLDEVIAKVIRGDVRPLLEREPQAPPDLAAIVGKAMTVDKAARYRTAGELAEDLRRFQTGQLVGAHRYTTGERFRRWLRRYRAIAIVAAIAMVVLAGYGTWSILKIRAESREAETRRSEAEAQAVRASTNANRAILSQARALRERDPSAALGWLHQMEVAGEGWDAARVFAADALSRPRLVAQMRGPSANSGMHLIQPELHIAPDGKRGVGFDVNGFWIIDLVAGTSRQLSHPHDPQYNWDVELCDDGNRVKVAKHGFVEADLFDVDLAAAKIDKRRGERAKWARSVEACRAMRAVRPTDTGLIRRDAAGVERSLSNAPTEAAWIAPDGAHVVALERDGTLRRFSGDGTAIGSIEGPPLEGVSLRDRATGWQFAMVRAALSSDGSAAITIHRDKARFWSFKHGSSKSFDKPPVGIAIQPDGSTGYVSTADSAWLVRNDGDPIFEIETETPLGRLATSPDGRWLVGLADGKVSITDTLWSGLRVIGHEGVHAFGFTGTGKLVTGADGTIRVWDLGEAPKPHDRGAAEAAAFSPDGRWYAIANRMSIVRRDLAGIVREELRYPSDMRPSEVAINDSGQVAVALGRDIYQWRRGAGLEKLGEHHDAMDVSVRITPDGTPITGTYFRAIVWRASGKREVPIPKAATRLLALPTFEVDDGAKRALVTCMPADETRRICFVDFPTGTVEVLDRSTGLGVMEATGRRAIVANDVDGYTLWDLDRIAPSRESEDLGRVEGLGISRDGKHAVATGVHGLDLIDLGRAATKRLRGQVRPASGRMEFSPSGTSFVDEQGKLWDFASGENRRIGLVRPRATFVGDQGLTTVTWEALVHVPDDLPRSPAALKQVLEKLPYRIEDDRVKLVAP